MDGRSLNKLLQFSNSHCPPFSSLREMFSGAHCSKKRKDRRVTDFTEARECFSSQDLAPGIAISAHVTINCGDLSIGN